jgi:hypothetical protein
MREITTSTNPADRLGQSSSGRVANLIIPRAACGLHEERYQVVLVNSNPATIMTDQNLPIAPTSADHC